MNNQLLISSYEYPMKEVVNLISNTDKVCFVIKQAFEPSYCNDLLAKAKKRGFSAASTMYPNTYRNNTRLQIDDQTLADELFSKCQQLVLVEHKQHPRNH